MKTYLTLLGLVLSVALYAQEIVQEYVPFEDSLFVLKTTNIQETGYDGILNTSVQYTLPPLDSVQLRQQIGNQAMNNINGFTGRLANNSQLRRLFRFIASADTLLQMLNLSYYDFSTALYGNRHSGTYRAVADTSDIILTIAAHPNRTDVLRATNEDTGDRWNVRVYNRDLIGLLNYEGDERYLLDDRVSDDRKVYRDPIYWLPTRFLPDGISAYMRLVKQQ